ncbi:MAG: hypothetical protein PHQ74_14705 [Crocinitomicaceae bacterium]|nr:hypothetical protein [Crocinitomicaceae bacterium]
MSQKENKAGRFKKILLAILLIGPASLLLLVSSRSCEHNFIELDVMADMPNYSFEDINGKTFTQETFKDHVVIFTTIQKTCPDSCSMSIWNIDRNLFKYIRESQKKMKHVKIVSFVTDGQGNPADNLAEIDFLLKDQVVAYDPKIWMLAKGDARKVYDISRNGAKLLNDEKGHYGGEAYQELLLLVDKNNKLRMVTKANEEDEVRKMYQSMALLEKQYDKEAFAIKHPKK